MKKTISTAIGFVAGCALIAAGAAQAQRPADSAAGYPHKPIRIIVPFGPGTSSDTLARLIAQELTAAWGQQVIVDNRTGAAAIVGTELAAKAVPDGYTLMVNGPGALAINMGMYPKLPYDTMRDFAPITNLVGVVQTLVVNPSFLAKTVPELVAVAKAKPGQLNYASFGIGSANHLTMVMFQKAAGIQLGNNVAFRGGADATLQMISGEVQIMFDTITAVLPQVKAGKLRGLAVSTLTRSPFMPELPTIAESGYPGFEVAAWAGILAPAKTPAPILDKIDREMVAALKKPEFLERLRQAGYTPLLKSRAEYGRYLASEIAKWTNAVKESGAKAAQ